MADQDTTQKPAQEPCCAPGCCSDKKPAASNGKRFLLITVVLAVCGILVYKFAIRAEATPQAAGSGFNTGIAGSTQPAAPASVSSQLEILSSMNALNEKAMDKDAVMVLVPSPTAGAVPGTVFSAIQSAQQTIQGKGIKLGLYQLQAGSADQTTMSSQLSLPAVLVLSKGKGMGTVTGDITADKLLQAFVSSNRSGGCCPSGAGSPSCPPAK